MHTYPPVRGPWRQPGLAVFVYAGTYLIDAWASLLLLGGGVQTPKRRKPAPSLACGSGHGLSTSSHSSFTSARCHLRAARRNISKRDVSGPLTYSPLRLTLQKPLVHSKPLTLQKPKSQPTLTPPPKAFYLRLTHIRTLGVLYGFKI